MLPEGVGDASGLAGSGVRVTVGLAGVRPEAGWLAVRYADGTAERVPLRLGSEAAVARLVLRKAGTYRVVLRSARGVTNSDPAVYSLGVIADAPPQIALLNGAEGDLAGTVRPVRFRVSDDTGFAGAALVWRVAAAPGRRAGPVRRVALPVRARPLEQILDLMWRMNGVRPGDTVEFYGEVREVGPGRRARTPLVRLRVPSVEERVETFASRRDSASTSLDRLRRQAERQSSRAERLREALRAKPEADWEARRQVEQLQREQADMQAQARQLQQQMREMAEQLRGSDVTTPDMQRRFEQMEQVIQDLQSPELQEALRRLQEAMEQLNLEQMLRQADNVEQQQATFEERLERAQALMERLEAAVEMEDAARQADDLARREEELSRDSERIQERQDGAPREPGERSEGAEQQRMAEEQRDAARDAAALDEALRELQERLDQIPNAPAEAVEQMREQTTPQGGLPQQMQQNAEQIQQGQMQPAQQGQQEMARQLRRMAQQMRQQSQSMQGQQQRVDAAALRRALEDVLTLSRTQEALATQAAATPDGNPALVGMARRQRDARDGLRSVADTLRRVARTSPQLTAAVQTRAQNGLREMEQALARLAARDAGPASANGRTAMSHLNELALLLSDALEQAQQQQSGGGGGGGTPSQQMQQMGEGQQRLNQQIQQMLNETAGERLTPGGRSPGDGQAGDSGGQRPGDDARRLRQIAEQQEALRRQLQNLIEQKRRAARPGRAERASALAGADGARRGRASPRARERRRYPAAAADLRAHVAGRGGRQRARAGGAPRGRDGPPRAAGPAPAAAAAGRPPRRPHARGPVAPRRVGLRARDAGPYPALLRALGRWVGVMGRLPRPAEGSRREVRGTDGTRRRRARRAVDGRRSPGPLAWPGPAGRRRRAPARPFRVRRAALVEKNRTRSDLGRQRDRLGFAGIDLTAQRPDERNVLNRSHLEPLRPRPELANDGRRRNHSPDDRRDEVYASDSVQRGQRRGIRDRHGRSPPRSRLNSPARSSGS